MLSVFLYIKDAYKRLYQHSCKTFLFNCWTEMSILWFYVLSLTLYGHTRPKCISWSHTMSSFLWWLGFLPKKLGGGGTHRWWGHKISHSFPSHQVKLSLFLKRMIVWFSHKLKRERVRDTFPSQTFFSFSHFDKPKLGVFRICYDSHASIIK